MHGLAPHEIMSAEGRKQLAAYTCQQLLLVFSSLYDLPKIERSDFTLRAVYNHVQKNYMPKKSTRLKIYPFVREMVVTWVHDVVIALKWQSSTFYAAMHLVDQYVNQCDKHMASSKLFLLAVLKKKSDEIFG